MFHQLTVGTGKDITISGGTLTPDANTYNGVDYDSFSFQVKVNPDPTNGVDPTYPTLWGGYTVWDYIKNGGSLYISALDDAGTLAESEKTEVVIPNRLTAQLVYEPHGDVATMTVPNWNNQTTNVNNDILTGEDPTAVVAVDQITPDAGYYVVGVVAKTAPNNTVNASDVNGDKSRYEYTMAGESVVMQVVFNSEDDPMKDKDPHIVAVYKVGDDGDADNSAAVVDMDVVIPSHQKGNIWTVAYEGNTVRVDVTMAPGYTAKITAVQKDAAKTPVQIGSFMTAPYVAGSVNSMYGKFEMPAGVDVDVTVTYEKSTTLPKYELTLTTVGTGGTVIAPNIGNKATLTPDGMASVTIDGEDKSERVPDAATLVAAGTELELITGHAAGYSVQSAVMVVSGVTVAIPLTDGEALPIPMMPMGDTEIIVTFQNQEQIARPYDPDHSEAYNSANYEHNETTTKPLPDLSQTHQEGWIKATGVDTKTKTMWITVPTLHDNAGNAPGTLYNAVTPEKSYKLYWKDNMGNFKELTTTGAYPDVELSDGAVVSDTYNGTSYAGYKFKVTILPDGGNSVDPTYPTLWGGYTLLNYMNNGGSIYISALDPSGVKAESEKTEVVIEDEEKDLQPYDPENMNDPSGTPAYTTPYEDHWITAENRGDTLVVTVPMLNKGGATDNTDAIDVDMTKHTFHLYLTANADQAEASWSYESLEGIFDVSHPDPTNTTDPYENDIYYTDKSVTPHVDYHGARYVLKIKSDPDIEQWVDDEVTAGRVTAANAPALKARLKELADMVGALMDNAGTTEAIENGVDWNNSGTKQNYRLFITHKDITENPVYESPYVDFEIPQYFSFEGILESYAPQHAATFSLYPLKAGAVNPLDEADYETKPVLTYDLAYTFGTGLLQQPFSVRSSHLMGRKMGRDGQGVVYKLVVEKPGHVTFTLVGLELTPDTLDTPAGRTFTLDTNVNDGTIALIAGDFDGDGGNTLLDMEYITNIMGGEQSYTRETDNTQPGWANSTYNPDSLAYAIDLDGNGKITALDLRIFNDPRNIRKTDASYQAVKPQLINAAAGNLNGGTVVVLLSLEEPVKLPEWLEELLQGDAEIPAWVMDMAGEEKEIPAWIMELVVAEKTVPDWAVELIQAEREIPEWTVECIQAGKIIPQWAVEYIQTERVISDWAIEYIQAEKEIPEWIIEYISREEELPQAVQDLLAAGEALPAERPDLDAPVEEPITPVNPDVPTEPSVEPDDSIDQTPDTPDTPTDSDIGTEPEEPEAPIEPTEEPDDSNASAVPDTGMDNEESAESTEPTEDSDDLDDSVKGSAESTDPGDGTASDTAAPVESDDLTDQLDDITDSSIEYDF